MKKTKIVATIGEASQDVATVTKLIQSGMDFVRMNFSHGSHDTHGLTIRNVRTAAKKQKKEITIFQDLSGPKLRLGEFKDRPVIIGEIVKFGQGGIPVQKEIWKWMKKGQIILIDDGNVELIATKVGKDGLDAKVTVSGMIKMRKGVSLPGVKVDLPSLSEKDLADLEFGVSKGMVDEVALSFVKTADDIQALRAKISEFTDRTISIIAKIETVESLENIVSIIKTSDRIMVARGDLAMNVDQDSVPLYQKQIVMLCRKYRKPVIVATQMLESMTNNPRPTRAEVADVANAVLDGAWGVMLSGETAYGSYPVKTVETMNDIIEKTENSSFYKVPVQRELVKA